MNPQINSKELLEKSMHHTLQKLNWAKLYEAFHWF